MKIKFILAVAALAAAANIQAVTTMEVPINDVFTLGTLSVTSGSNGKFQDGLFTFNTPITDFKDYYLYTVFDTDGADTLISADFYTVGQTFIDSGIKNMAAGNFNYEFSGGLPEPRDLTAIRFYIHSGGGADCGFLNFENNFRLSKLVEIPDPPIVHVPDGGATGLLLGIGSVAIAVARKKMNL